MQITASAYFVLVLMLMMLPLDWVASILTAAAFHEICHCAVILFLGGRIHALKIKAGGAVIETCISGAGRELVCAMAGPLGSFLLLNFGRLVPQMAICGFAQGVVNLVPIFPLDGGRILKCCLELVGISNVEKVLLCIKWMVFLFLALVIAVLVMEIPLEK